MKTLLMLLLTASIVFATPVACTHCTCGSKDRATQCARMCFRKNATPKALHVCAEIRCARQRSK